MLYNSFNLYIAYILVVTNCDSWETWKSGYCITSIKYVVKMKYKFWLIHCKKLAINLRKAEIMVGTDARVMNIF